MTKLAETRDIDAGGERDNTLEIKAGTVLKDRFLLLKEIGRGGLSTVYKARDLVAAKAGLADPNVAIKIIRAAHNVDPDVIALMHREARRLRDLVHPNIVRVYDMDRQGDIHFMVMELLEGQPLSQLLRKAPGKRLQAAQLNRLIQDLATALTHAHGRGIIHADLKPGNVFVLNNGGAKLIDFNIAYPIARPIKTREEDTIVILARFGAVTPAYASPQRMTGAEPCEADDVFSLSVIAYLAYSGTRPYTAKNALEARKEGQKAVRPEGLTWLRWRALRAGLALDDFGRTDSAKRFAEGFCSPGPLTLAKHMVSDFFNAQEEPAETSQAAAPAPSSNDPSESKSPADSLKDNQPSEAGK
ncbi:serine/threonine-protein kinase [Roseibium sediminicola]|uniref:Serine/threonine protein kinase n=1 Tax=Roseibium sediminicola TaxID=2933272 RepID=A0ABT0GV10_9HYPH|nr:serine/threonine-protein kinase [Roseibium sp. CAU 1639]MCK7613268.1 serine/threonine protein kinase [Roseibium sp. CAU 1639]